LVDGGMTSNNTFCQLLSDSLGIDISKPSNIESTALGACVVSQISEGVPLEEIKNKLDKKFISNEANSSFYKHDYEAWKNYLESSIANLKDK
jgi:glycerol kinase